MPRGLSKISQVAKENAERRKAYDEAGPGLRFLKLNDGDTARVRFLEQGEEVWYLWTHKLPKQPGQSFGDDVQCLDQDNTGVACPGCERNKGRSAKMVINLIWYGAPRIVRDGEGKPVKKDGKYQFDGVEDCVATWVRGSNVGGRLEYLDSQYGGLTGHLFSIHRRGSGKDDTQYDIDLAQQGATPTAEDRKLHEGKPDPRRAIKEMTYGDMARAYSGGGAATTTPSGDGQAAPAGEGNSFAAAASGGAINKGAFGL